MGEPCSENSFYSLYDFTANASLSWKESAERDQELHIQAVLSTKQQQIETFMSMFEMLQQQGRSRSLICSDMFCSFSVFLAVNHRARLASFQARPGSKSDRQFDLHGI